MKSSCLFFSRLFYFILTGYLSLFFLPFLSFPRFFSLSSHFSPFSLLCSLSVLRSLPLFSIALVTFSVLHSSSLSSIDFLVAFGLTVGLGFGLSADLDLGLLGVGLGFGLDADLGLGLLGVGLGFCFGADLGVGWSRRGRGFAIRAWVDLSLPARGDFVTVSGNFFLCSCVCQGSTSLFLCLSRQYWVSSLVKFLELKFSEVGLNSSFLLCSCIKRKRNVEVMLWWLRIAYSEMYRWKIWSLGFLNIEKEWIKNIIFKWDKRIKKVYLNRVEIK